MSTTYYHPNPSVTRNIPPEALAFVNYIENPFSSNRQISSMYNQSATNNTKRSFMQSSNPYRDNS